MSIFRRRRPVPVPYLAEDGTLLPLDEDVEFVELPVAEDDDAATAPSALAEGERIAAQLGETPDPEFYDGLAFTEHAAAQHTAGADAADADTAEAGPAADAADGFGYIAVDLDEDPHAFPARPAFLQHGSVSFTALFGAAAAAFELVEPTSLDADQSELHRLALAALVGAATHAGVQEAAQFYRLAEGRTVKRRHGCVAGTLTGAAAGALVRRFAAPLVRWDVKTIGWLSGLGVQHPRRWLAVATLGLAVVDAVQARRDRREAWTQGQAVRALDLAEEQARLITGRRR